MNVHAREHVHKLPHLNVRCAHVLPLRVLQHGRLCQHAQVNGDASLQDCQLSCAWLLVLWYVAQLQEFAGHWCREDGWCILLLLIQVEPAAPGGRLPWNCGS